MTDDALLHREQNVHWFGTDYAERDPFSGEESCWCWNDPELASRGFYCRACTEVMDA